MKTSHPGLLAAGVAIFSAVWAGVLVFIVCRVRSLIGWKCSGCGAIWRDADDACPICSTKRPY